MPTLLLAVWMVARRIFLPCYLELEPDAALIPAGRQRVKVRYADIEATQERIFGTQKQIIRPMMAFKLRTKERTFEINSKLLPDKASYVEIRDFITSRVTPKEEKPKSAERGLYGFHCAYEGNGAIYNSLGEILWRFKTWQTGTGHYPYGVFHLPDFVVADPADKEVYRIKLKRQFSLGKFEMTENGAVICVIRQRSFLRNKFTLEFSNGQKWVFRMPLFSVRFGGISDSGAKVRVLVRTHNLWHVWIDPAADNRQLVAALAFIHRERLRFN